MLLPDGKMGVIDFGAVAPMPGGFPVELGRRCGCALDKNYDELLPAMEEVGFIQKGERVSDREIDDMLRQYVEPIEVEVFHFTRKWLQRMTAVNWTVGGQIKAARQMDMPAKLAIPMRVIASIVAISCQLDAHVPTQRIADGTGSRASPKPPDARLSAQDRQRIRRLPVSRCSCAGAHADACVR